MSRIKASDIPPPLLHAFVDALEAWVLLEHQLFMIWQFLSGATEIEKAWEEFSNWSTWKQQARTVKLVEEFREETQYAPSTPEVFERLEELTGTRNRIVHGNWRSIHSDRLGIIGYVRVYEARGHSARPIDEKDEQRMLGISRFYEPELRKAEQRFREAARDIHHAETAIIISQHRKK